MIIKDVPIGDHFLYDRSIYMKIDSWWGEDYEYGVDSNGIIIRLSPQQEVKKSFTHFIPIPC